MPRNPLTDIWQFFTGATGDYMALGSWRYLLLALFLALVVASLYFAARNWREDPAQRTGTHLGTWFVRARRSNVRRIAPIYARVAAVETDREDVDAPQQL